MKPSPAQTFGALGLGGLALTIAIHYPTIAVWVFGLLLALCLAIESTAEARKNRKWRGIVERSQRGSAYYVPPHPTTGQKPN